MTKLFKYLKKSWGLILLVIIFLGLQAICDLALPTYTADIIDVGISQGGIKNAVPESILAERMSALKLYMTPAEWNEVEESYELDGENYRLRSSQTMDTMTTAFTRAYVIEAFISGKLPDTMMDGAAAEGMPAMPDGKLSADVLAALSVEQRNEMINNADEFLQGINGTILEQFAITCMKTDYVQSGMDMSRIQTNYVLVAGLKMLGVALAGTFCAIAVVFMSSRLAASLGRDLRRRMFSNVLAFSQHEMEAFSTASLITRTTNDIQQVQTMLVMLLRIVIYAPINGIGGIVKVMGTNSSMTWVIALAVSLLLIVIIFLFTTTMPRFKKLQILVDKVNLVTREILSGLPVIRAFSTEEREEQRFDEASTALKKTQLFVNRAMSGMMPMMMIIMNGTTVLIMWLGSKNISTGTLQAGDMMAFIQYTMQIIMSFLMISMVSIMIPRAAVSMKRIDEVITTQSSIQDKDKTVSFDETKKGLVSFEQVYFTYPDATESVLSDISFTARPGETTAILGGTGSGKSTLVNLIPRFFDVTKGTITVDGVDIRNVKLQALRERIGYVPQKGLLFSGTIASNIGYGQDEMSIENMQRAASIAQAEQFIDAKEEKYEAPISQGGSNVSGGQKQRLSIARAIAKNPEIFVFDDSFSALDYKTDVALRTALKKETRDATVIIVAQRISTVLSADQIIVLDDGRIAGIGTHTQLLESCEVYQQIAQSQLSKEELENAKQ